MPVHVHPGTMPGGVTPICGCCGISLCWDISDEDYATAKKFWDDWQCQDCNGGEPMSLKDWQRGQCQPEQPKAQILDEFRVELLKLAAEDPVAYEQFLTQAADVLRGKIKERTALINQLAAVATLSAWEKGFVASMQTHALSNKRDIAGYALLTISRKQKDCLTALHEKHCALVR